MSLRGLKIGDDVMWSSYRGTTRVPVEKVGRKYITARRTRFSIENGQGDYGHIESLASYEERCSREEAVRSLALYGVDLRHGSPSRKRAVEVLAVVRKLFDPTPTEPGGEAGR